MASRRWGSAPMAASRRTMSAPSTTGSAPTRPGTSSSSPPWRRRMASRLASHLIRGDGGTGVMFGENIVSTVGDGISTSASVRFRRHALRQRDGNDNQTVSDVADWLNYFYADQFDSRHRARPHRRHDQVGPWSRHLDRRRPDRRWRRRCRRWTQSFAGRCHPRRQCRCRRLDHRR